MSQRTGAVALVAVLMVGLLVVPVSVGARQARAAAPGLPAGFVVTALPSGQRGGDLTDFAYLPDDSMITTGKGGTVAWVSADGATVRTLATLPVATVQDLGLVGVAVAPDYEATRAIYLARSLPGSSGAWPLRLSRFTVTGAAEPTGLAGERVLLETTATSDVHAMTGIEANPNGTLWVSIGDAADFRRVDPAALRALDVTDPRGKLLHIRGSDGAGVPGNPFYDPANPGATRSKVYAMGFRSPFRVAVHPASGAPILGDVGWNVWEEVNLVRPGARYGWPCFEGDGPTPGYRDLAGCAGEVNTAPSHAYRHTQLGGPGNSVTGGVVYTGTQYPAAYSGAYFFGDYTTSTVWTMRIAADGTVTRAPESGGFGQGMGGPVSFDTGPGGDIVYADIFDGTIKRISYVSGNRPPTAVATSSTDPATRTVTFDGSGSYDLDGDALTYRWEFGDGSVATGEHVTHRYAADGPDSYTARLSVTDAVGNDASTTLTVAPSNNPPELSLTAPRSDQLFRVGDLVTARATAADSEDEDSLVVRWSSVAVHCREQACHDHPGEQVTGESYSFVFDDHGDDTEVHVTATVTDSTGVATSETFVARPDLRTLLVAANVPTAATINGVVRDTAEVTVGARVSVSVPATAADGVSTFESWSDGAARAHDITAGDADRTLTATYTTPIDRRYASDPTLRSVLGAPTAPETGDTALRWRDYEHGRVYWSPQTGVRSLTGGIHAKFLALGGHAAVGVPRTDERGTPDGVGRYNHFDPGASIYWTPRTGAHLVLGAIRERWQSLRWERGFLGYPRTDQRVTPDGVGRYNHFEGGSIYWSPRTDAWEVHGAIRDRWRRTGWERGPLSYPVTNETRTPDGIGRYSHFSGSGGGSIYWTPRTGAHEVYGAIRDRWQARGWERSYLAYPTSGEFAIPGGRRTNFEHGYITWDRSTGRVVDRRY